MSLPVPRHGLHGGCSGASRASGSGVSAISRRNVVGRRPADRILAAVPDHLVLRGGPPDRADGRFAPSPTGTLHLGNLRTALLAWLLARAAGARFLVRIEDLDAGRVREPFVAEQLADLAALGLDHDGEVVRQSGADRPVRGGDRAAAGRRARLPLLVHARGDPRGGVGAARGPARGRLPRHLPRPAGSAGSRRARRPDARPRCACAPAPTVERFADRLCGHVTGVVDDFVVRRNDGAFAYNLAVVVDDAEQGVGEVVRGADLLDSTPRQLWLQRRLGAAAARLRARPAAARRRRRAPGQARRRHDARRGPRRRPHARIRCAATLAATVGLARARRDSGAGGTRRARARSAPLWGTGMTDRLHRRRPHAAAGRLRCSASCASGSR